MARGEAEVPKDHVTFVRIKGPIRVGRLIEEAAIDSVFVFPTEDHVGAAVALEVVLVTVAVRLGHRLIASALRLGVFAVVPEEDVGARVSIAEVLTSVAPDHVARRTAIDGVVVDAAPD